MATDDTAKSVCDYPLPEDGRPSGDWTQGDIERYLQRWGKAVEAAAKKAAAEHGQSVDELTRDVLSAWLLKRGYLKPPRVKKRATPGA
jgi:hypothetical protein